MVTLKIPFSLFPNPPQSCSLTQLMNPSNQWEELENFLDAELIESAGEGHHVWSVSWTAERSMESLLQKFKEVEGHFISQIEEVIETWCATGMATWPEMHESAKAL